MLHFTYKIMRDVLVFSSLEQESIGMLMAQVDTEGDEDDADDGSNGGAAEASHKRRRRVRRAAHRRADGFEELTWQ